MGQVGDEEVGDLRRQGHCVVDYLEGSTQAIIHVELVALDQVAWAFSTITNLIPLNEYVGAV